MKNIKKETYIESVRLFATGKTHKFTDIKQININVLKLRPIIDQIGTHLFDCSNKIVQYLQLLAIKEYRTSDSLSFPDILRGNVLDSNEVYML